MTKEETKKAVNVMLAYLDGKKIEAATSLGTFTCIDSPTWVWENNPNRYRIEEIKVAKFEPGDHVLVFGKYLARVIEYGYLGCMLKSLDGRLQKVDCFYKETDIQKIDKFDVNCLQPFDKVLVKDSDDAWKVNFFGYISNGNYPFSCCGCGFRKCVPYNEDTVHLLGTKNDAPAFYNTWDNDKK